MSGQAMPTSLTMALTAAQGEIEQALDILLPREEGREAPLFAAMRYAAMGGGKRMRGFLVLEGARQFNVARASALRVAAATDEQLRAAGLSRQKAGYARSLADEVTSGRLPLAALPEDDEEAIAALTRVKGIGRWSAEIYLLFAEGRSDIWPAGDLAVQIEVGRILGHDDRPSEKLTRTLAEPWRPHRGAAAVFAWHHYGWRLVQGKVDRLGKDGAPL